MRYFVSLAVGPYRDAGYRIALEARKLGYFDSVRVITEWDGDVREWHATVLSKTLQTLKENDILVLANAGYHLNTEKKEWQIIFDALEGRNVIAFESNRIERNYTKGDLFDNFKFDLAFTLATGKQLSTTITGWRCNLATHQFAKQWSELLKKKLTYMMSLPPLLPTGSSLKGHLLILSSLCLSSMIRC